MIHKDRYVTDLKPWAGVPLEDGAPRKFTVFANAMAGNRIPPRRKAEPDGGTWLFGRPGASPFAACRYAGQDGIILRGDW